MLETPYLLGCGSFGLMVWQRMSRRVLSFFMYLSFVLFNLSPMHAQVVRNVVFEPRLLPGGGATEMAVSQALSKKAQVTVILPTASRRLLLQRRNTCVR